MSIDIPDKWLGKPIKGALERALQNPVITPPAPQPMQTVITPATNAGINKAQYIILPGKRHDGYEYGDTLVGVERIHLNQDWNISQKALHDDGAYMLTIRQFVDFLNLLRSGQAFDGNGSKIQPSRLGDIYGEITQVRDPWRSEWLDAKFTEQQISPKTKIPGLNVGVPFTGKKEMYIAYNAIDSNGVLTEVSEPLEAYLDKNKTPGISLDDWLKGATKHGLPSPNVPGGKMYYWQPTNNHVAWFVANSVGADLSCDRGPSFRYSELGVRAARVKS